MKVNRFNLSTANYFALFSASHSFIIGLLPFFLPVLIWQQTQSLSDLANFVSWTGAGYAITLVVWHKIFQKGHWKILVFASFITEACLIYCTLFYLNEAPLILLGLLNGVFNCCYWMLQRVLFNTISNNKNSGRLFGNLQLFLGFSLKLGILISGYLMVSNPWLIFSLSSVISITFSYIAYKDVSAHQMVYTTPSQEIMGSHQSNFKVSISWKDKFIFIIDGPFLYLESYLWVLSIYLLTDGSNEAFSITVIAISLALGVIFFFVKNIIDKQEQQQFYQLTIVLYLLSWLARGFVDPQWNAFMISLVLLTIAFATALFRLYFNKRFYDRAKQHASYQYIYCKSLYSQISIGVFFAILAFTFADNTLTLNHLYWLVLPITLIYFIYAQTVYAQTNYTQTSDAQTKNNTLPLNTNK